MKQRLGSVAFVTWSFLVLTTTALLPAAAGGTPYTHLPKAGDAVRFDASALKANAAWAYADQGWLETFLRASIDAAIAGTGYDDERSAVGRARQRAVAVDNGTQGLVGEVQPFHYRGHDDAEVQVLIKQGALRNHIYWTTAGELVDGAGHKYLR